MKIKLYLIIIVLISQPIFAFDAERQGLVVGGGAGFAPIAYTEIDGLRDSRESSASYALNFMIGYGYNENTQFLLMAEGVRTNAIAFESAAEPVWQGFSGVGVRFYFDDIGSSFFITSGIGLQLYLNSKDSEFAHNSGIGVLIGGGYEFTENLQLQTNLSNGQTKDSFNWNHLQLVISVSFMLY